MKATLPPPPAEERGAEQVAVEPPLDPAQLQLHGPLPLTPEAEPVVHSPLVGAVLVMTPFAGPHWPLTGAEASSARQVAVVPPLLPAQLHDHGPLPLTGEAAPAVQRLAVGALVRLAPFEVPQAPFTGCAEATLVAEQVAVVPPPLPAQLHDHGPLPLTADAVPVLQRLAVGALARLPPFEAPHAPLTAVGDVEEVASVA